MKVYGNPKALDEPVVKVKDLIKDLEFCRDWLDVGSGEKEQANQLKVLMKLSEMCDILGVEENDK